MRDSSSSRAGSESASRSPPVRTSATPSRTAAARSIVPTRASPLAAHLDAPGRRTSRAGWPRSAAIAASARARGVPVSITGAAVATIASQASTPSRSRPLQAVDGVDDGGQRHRPAPVEQAQRAGLAQRRQVVAQRVAADRERGGVDLLVEQQRAATRPRRPGRGRARRCRRPGSDSTSRPRTTSCRSGEAPNTRSPSPVSSKKVAGAGLTAQSSANAARRRALADAAAEALAQGERDQRRARQRARPHAPRPARSRRAAKSSRRSSRARLPCGAAASARARCRRRERRERPRASASSSNTQRDVLPVRRRRRAAACAARRRARRAARSLPARELRPGGETMRLEAERAGEDGVVGRVAAAFGERRRGSARRAAIAPGAPAAPDVRRHAAKPACSSSAAPNASSASTSTPSAYTRSASDGSTSSSACSGCMPATPASQPK